MRPVLRGHVLVFDSNKLHLRGSPRRDLFKQMHKTLDHAFYATDIDFALVSKSPPGIVAFIDYKSPYDMVQFSEVLAYNVLSKIAPVYIIEAANPQTGPFAISLFSTGDYRPHPPKVKLTLIAECRNWEELEAWERKLRQLYEDRGR